MSEVRSRFEQRGLEEFFDLIDNKEVTQDDIDKFKYKIEEDMDVQMSIEKEKWMNEFIESYKINEGFCDVVKLRSEITFLCDEYYVVQPRFENELKKLIFNLDIELIED